MKYSFAVSSEYVDTELLIAPRRHGDGDESAMGYSSIQPLGLIARPRDPDQDDDGEFGAAAGALFVDDGGETFVMPTTDPRALDKVPPLKPGGTALYSYPGGCIVLDGENGSLLVLVPNEDASKNHALSFDSAASALSIVHAEGMSFVMQDDAKHSIAITGYNGDTGLIVDDDGVALNGNSKVVGSLVVGNIAAAEAVPLHAAWNDWATTISQVVGTLAAAVNVLAPGTVDPVTLATLVTQTSALATLGKSTTLSASATP